SRCLKTVISLPSCRGMRRSWKGPQSTSISSRIAKKYGRRRSVKANRVIRVVVIVIVALATATFLYLLMNNFQFTRGISVRVHFTSIGDLNTGSWVRKAGIKVGSVTALTPAPDEKTVIVTLSFRPGQIVRHSDQFALVSKGILGDVYIEQHPGPIDSP